MHAVRGPELLAQHGDAVVREYGGINSVLAFPRRQRGVRASGLSARGKQMYISRCIHV